MAALIFLGIAAVLLIYAISLYNHLVNVKHAVAKAWANIDVLLKQRHDELPKLVEVCKQYKQFEQARCKRSSRRARNVQAARQKQDIPALGQAEGMLRMGLGDIFAVAEAYPELKANENFMQLQDPHHLAGERHRRPPRVVQRIGEHQQRADRGVSRQHHRKAVQLRRKTAAGILRRRKDRCGYEATIRLRSRPTDHAG